ncbi:MAG: hypothetical protein ACLR8P_06640 [Clostridium fessum]
MSASTATQQWSCGSPIEAFGTDHKNKIVEALKEAGYRPKLVKSKISMMSKVEMKSGVDRADRGELK